MGVERRDNNSKTGDSLTVSRREFLKMAGLSLLTAACERLNVEITPTFTEQPPFPTPIPTETPFPTPRSAELVADIETGIPNFVVRQYSVDPISLHREYIAGVDLPFSREQPEYEDNRILGWAASTLDEIKIPTRIDPFSNQIVDFGDGKFVYKVTEDIPDNLYRGKEAYVLGDPTSSTKTFFEDTEFPFYSYDEYGGRVTETPSGKLDDILLTDDGKRVLIAFSQIVGRYYWEKGIAESEGLEVTEKQDRSSHLFDIETGKTKEIEGLYSRWSGPRGHPNRKVPLLLSEDGLLIYNHYDPKIFDVDSKRVSEVFWPSGVDRTQEVDGSPDLKFIATNVSYAEEDGGYRDYGGIVVSTPADFFFIRLSNPSRNSGIGLFSDREHGKMLRTITNDGTIYLGGSYVKYGLLEYSNNSYKYIPPKSNFDTIMLDLVIKKVNSFEVDP